MQDLLLLCVEIFIYAILRSFRKYNTQFFPFWEPFLLLRSLYIKEYGNDGVEDIGYPHGQHGVHASIDGKRGRYRLEKDVGEAQRQTYPQI